jgi:hypothetical protein
MAELGACVKKVNIHHMSDTEIKFTAAKFIKKGEYLLKIPRKLLIARKDTLELCPLAKKLGEETKMRDSELLAISLLHEKTKGDDSVWSNYL